VVAPIYLHLFTILFSKENENIQVAAQNCSRFENGAYTGEVSAEQLEDLSVKWVVIRHSDRRSTFKETSDVVKEKVKMALTHKLKVIYCFEEVDGEEKEMTQLNDICEVVNEFNDNSSENWDNIVLVYNPSSKPTETKTEGKDVKEVHKAIRDQLKVKGIPKTDSVPIIYGGNVTS
jgi:triosephosphate isomerase